MAAVVMLCGRRMGRRWQGLAVWVLLCVAHLSTAVEVYTPDELFVENGTQAKLTCTFKSTEVTYSRTAVSWSFVPDSGENRITIFHYTDGKSFPGTYGPFKDRITWAGDINKKDASIKVDNMQSKDNGSYICNVVNPPDIVCIEKKIKLQVVEKENLPLSNVPLLIGIICAVIGALLIVASIIFAVCIFKKKKSRKHYSGCSTTDSLMAQTPFKQPPRKSPCDTEALVTQTPSAPVQVNRNVIHSVI
ncbi:hypothetical protein GDO86_002649 [Hymenochirus boettgeri]|uniref:Myelin protein P0 n=1 Tax=Hymenochirus boettgeri TaxID=247094 RepID=A0A8T2K634_9PIPI|nr:hypothetical protein GDO86_002649 [Hymenochirus boettgeri]